MDRRFRLFWFGLLVVALYLSITLLIKYMYYSPEDAPFYRQAYSNKVAIPGFPSIKLVEFKLDLPVLTYHYIRTVENPEQDQLGFSLSVTPQDFRKQMEFLIQHDYVTVTPSELYHALRNKKPLPPRSVLLTFDDGYADFYYTAFPILNELNLKATVFVLPGFAGGEGGTYISWGQMRELDASGFITIASHTLHHVNVTSSSRSFTEIFQSKRILQEQLGHPITAFAYPYGAFNEATIASLKQVGYELAFTTKIGTTMRYSNRFALPRVRVSGGLPLELFPAKLNPVTELTK